MSWLKQRVRSRGQELGLHPWWPPWASQTPAPVPSQLLREHAPPTARGWGQTRELSALTLPPPSSPGTGADHPPDLAAGLPRPGPAEGEAGRLAAAGALQAALLHRPDAAHPAGEARWGPREAGREETALWGEGEGPHDGAPEFGGEFLRAPLALFLGYSVRCAFTGSLLGPWCGAPCWDCRWA